MEEFASLWSCQGSADDLKQKLLCTTLELEQLKVEANEEMRKNQEHVKQLFQLVKIACQERNEARDLLQKILNRVMSTTNSTEFFPGLLQFQLDSPLLKPTKANSTATESNSFSETYNNPSDGSSLGESFLDAVLSPELTNINMGDSSSIAFVNQPLIQDCNRVISNSMVPSAIPKVDVASLMTESFSRGKNLPQKGRFLKAVLDAGPLLQNLLVAGPLPRWRNPPQLQKAHIPPVSVQGCDADIINMKSATNMSPVASRLLISRPYAEMSCSPSQILSPSMLNTNGSTCLGDDRLISSGDANSYIPLGKRQRFC
ncbi:unnamed protein product [Coffea canephora]|uniref:Uncharacterized protein n=1 Tax=Coffea canephora TaxID=49390 RepID=A0A068UZX6_COFCA|nr:unnamed protein product [Coffea canephora]